MNENGDRFHAGYLFALFKFLSLKWQIALLPRLVFSYDEFEQSFKQTLHSLGIEEKKKSVREEG
jgi:hypothetical protein